VHRISMYVYLLQVRAPQPSFPCCSLLPPCNANPQEEQICHLSSSFTIVHTSAFSFFSPFSRERITFSKRMLSLIAKTNNR
jgi:hypothetical protein